MAETVKLKLKKPTQDDFYNIDDHNGNADIIDSYAVSMDNEIKGLKQQDQSLSVEITNLKKKDTAIDVEIAGLKTKDISQDTEISKLKTADIDLGKRIDGVVTKDTAQDAEVAALKTKDVSISNDITALKAKDTSIDTEISKLKTADVTYSNAIKAEAQMKKITRDNGAPFLTIQSGEDAFDKFDELDTGIYFINMVAGALNTPVTTSAFFGIVKKAFSWKTYWTAEVINYTTGKIHTAANQNGVRRGWHESATIEHVETQKKSVTAVAQMNKMTYDNGSVYTISDGFANFVKTMGRGVKFVYMNKTGAPDGPGTVRGIISQTGDVSATVELGFYWSICVDYSGNIWTSHASSDGSAVVKWNKITPSSILGGTAAPSNSLGNDGDIYVQYI